MDFFSLVNISTFRLQAPFPVASAKICRHKRPVIFKGKILIGQLEDCHGKLVPTEERDAVFDCRCKQSTKHL